MATFQQHHPSQNHSANNNQPHLASASQSIAAAPISSSASHAGSYPAQHQQQQQLSQPYNPQQQLSPHLQPLDPDHATRLNTISNSTPYIDPVGPRGGKFTEEWDASQRGSSIMEGHQGATQVAHSYAGSIGPSDAGDQHTVSLSRGNTLKKKASMRRSGSLKRSGSRRSMHAGSVKSLALQSSNDPDEMHSAFFCPVPTTGNPSEALANRFQAWRKILKDLITYFREIQTHYESRSKSLLKLGNALNSTQMPPGFLPNGGLDDALQILRNYNKHAILEASKAREIEEDVILALTGLRSDLSQKIKEIKNLSGDFKNTVEREMAATRRAVDHLQEVLGQAEHDSALTTGKQDPYLLRLAVDRQLERQIDEENYLHQAYLNLETSGRELEAIVVGEIQKSYNAYAGILKRDADAAYIAIEQLRTGPIAMPKDHEWSYFISRDEQFVDPDLPLRSAEYIHYPGRDHYACQEVRAGLLERKSKYLKSYTAGWYVLSPTHLHEFKSADKTQAPIMSLYLPEQKLGSHSAEGHSSNKFILKGRQTGGMHRGHTWVFRAESHDTMMAWYEDIKALTEKSPEERSNFVRGHVRSLSRSSQHSTRSMSSDGHVDDDDDEPPFAATAESVQVHQAIQQPQSQPRQEDAAARRPEQGGRFPSDLQVNAQRGLQAPVSPSSVSSGSIHRDREQHQRGLDSHQDRHELGQQQNRQQQAYPEQQQQQQQQQQQPKDQHQHRDHQPTNNQQHDTQQYQTSGTDYHEDSSQYQRPATGYNEDPNEAIRQAAALPGVVMLAPQPQYQQPYSAVPDPKPYGSTDKTPMDEAPSHAAVVSAEALEDGVNPYTNEPVHDGGQSNHDTGYFPNDVAVASRQVPDDARPGPERRLSSRAEGTGLMVVGLEEQQRRQSEAQIQQQQQGYQRPDSVLSESGNHNQAVAEDHVPDHQDDSRYQMTGALSGVPVNKPYVPHQRMYHQQGAPDLPEEQHPSYQQETPLNAEPGEATVFGTTSYATRPLETEATPYPIRPAATTRNHSEAPTVSTIAHLHVPGEYPRGSQA